MSRLTDDQVIRITRAAVLLTLAGDVLSSFEVELIQEVGMRFVERRRAAEVTSYEWPVLDGAVKAMAVTHERRRARQYPLRIAS